MLFGCIVCTSPAVGGRTTEMALASSLLEVDVARGRLAARFCLISRRLRSGVLPNKIPWQCAWCSFKSFASFYFGVGSLARLTIVLVAAKFENLKVSFASAPNFASWSFLMRNGFLFPTLRVVVSGVWITMRVLSGSIQQCQGFCDPPVG